MRRWWLIVALLLSLGLNIGILSSLALRRWAPKPPPAFEEVRDVQDLADALGLEGDTRESFVDLHEEIVVRARKNVRSYRQAQRQLRREVARRKPDRLRVEGAISRIEQLHGERHRLVVQAMLRSRRILDRRQLRLYRRFLGELGRRLNLTPARRGGRGAPEPRGDEDGPADGVGGGTPSGSGVSSGDGVSATKNDPVP